MKATVRDRDTVAKITKPVGIAALALGLCAGSAMARPLGVDVSSYQGNPNWSSVKSSGITFAFAKATEGTFFIDSTFSSNQSNGKGAGLYMGAYHFAHPDQNSPGAEASYFWNVAGPYIVADGKTLMPVLDFEVFNGVVGASSYADWANQWCTAVKNYADAAGVSVKPIIYTSSCTACDFNSSVSQWNSWIANYNGEDPQTGTPWSVCSSCAVWGSGVWGVWQYSSSASVSGISGSCDVDVFNGSSSGLVSSLVVGGSVVINPNPMPFNTIGHNGNGAMDFYMVGNNNYAFHNYQTTPNSSWLGFSLTSGSPVLNPGSVEASNQDGRLESFFVGTDGNVYHRYQTAVNGAWSGYYSLGQAGGGATKVVAGINADGRLEIFITGADKHVYHRWQDVPNGSWNAGWSQLGGWQLNGGLCVGFNQDGRQQVFGYGTDGNVDTIWQTAVNGAWGNWVGMGGATATYTTCASDADGRLEVFAIVNGQVCHQWQTTPNGSWNGSWASMSWGASAVVAARNTDGRLELMAIGSPNGYVAHNYQTAANGGWNGFGKLLGQNFVATDLAFSVNQDGRLELFAVGSDTAVWHIWQTSPGSAWNSNGWSSMGGSWRHF